MIQKHPEDPGHKQGEILKKKTIPAMYEVQDVIRNAQLKAAALKEDMKHGMHDLNRDLNRRANMVEKELKKTVKR